MNWSFRRKSIYASAVIILVSATSLYLLRDIIFPAPTCSDGKQNGFEVGVDCGGSTCGPRCSFEVQPLTVLWARTLQTSKDTYDIVAMISNKNINNASHGISYTFVVYDKEGRVIKKSSGETIAPIDGDFPIINQSVKLTQVPYTVTVEIADGIHYTVNEKPTSPTLRISNERYEVTSISRAYATIQNTKRKTLENLPVMIVLYDENNNAYAVGGTVIPRLDKEEFKEVSFTWDTPLTAPPVRIKVYPIFDPFLALE
jgi:hypothetical protein